MKICVNHRCDETCTLNKEFFTTQKKTTQFKNGQNFNRHYSKEDIQLDNTHMKDA